MMWEIYWLPAITVMVVALIIVVGKVLRAKAESVDKQKLKQMLDEIREANVHLKAELAAIKDNVAAVHKILKEVE